MGCEKLREEFRVKNFKLQMDRPAGLITFEWPIPHPVYVVWRLLMMAYCLAVMIQGAASGGTTMQDFTHWSFSILTGQSIIHFIVCMIYTFHPTLRILKGNTPYATAIVSNVDTQQSGASTDESKIPLGSPNVVKLPPINSNEVKKPLDTSNGDTSAQDSPDEAAVSTPVTPIGLQFLWVWTEVAYTAAITVTLLYYLLVSTSFNPSFDDYSVHLLNTIFVMIDMWLTNIQFRLLHVVYFYCYVVLYLVFSAIYYGATGISIYEILNWGNPGLTVGWCIALLFITSLIFFLMFGIATLRSFIQVKCCPQRWNSLPDGNSVAPTEEEMIK